MCCFHHFSLVLHCNPQKLGEASPDEHIVGIHKGDIVALCHFESVVSCASHSLIFLPDYDNVVVASSVSRGNGVAVVNASVIYYYYFKVRLVEALRKNAVEAMLYVLFAVIQRNYYR